MLFLGILESYRIRSAVCTLFYWPFKCPVHGGWLILFQGHPRGLIRLWIQLPLFDPTTHITILIIGAIKHSTAPLWMTRETQQRITVPRPLYPLLGFRDAVLSTLLLPHPVLLMCIAQRSVTCYFGLAHIICFHSKSMATYPNKHDRRANICTGRKTARRSAALSVQSLKARNN